MINISVQLLIYVHSKMLIVSQIHPSQVFVLKNIYGFFEYGALHLVFIINSCIVVVGLPLG